MTFFSVAQQVNSGLVCLFVEISRSHTTTTTTTTKQQKQQNIKNDKNNKNKQQQQEILR
jgi:hypothetical protein